MNAYAFFTYVILVERNALASFEQTVTVIQTTQHLNCSLHAILSHRQLIPSKLNQPVDTQTFLDLNYEPALRRASESGLGLQHLNEYLAK